MSKVLSEKEFQDQLTEQEKRYDGKTVIANLYQLGLEGGKRFSRELKKLIREDVPVEMAHLASINGQWGNAGKLYEIDEEKTEAFQKNLSVHKDVLAKRDKAEKLGAKKLSQALSEMGTEEAGSEEAEGKSGKKKSKSGSEEAEGKSGK
jgi:hypothetical protein